MNLSKRSITSYISTVLYFLARFIMSRTAIGIGLVACASFFYYAFGFNWPMFTLWLAGIIACGLPFVRSRTLARLPITRTDFAVSLTLFLISLPVFLWSIYTVPFQMADDESTNIHFEQTWADQRMDDIFGLSPYFGFPYFPYLLLGWLGKLLGGINLFHQRLLHGSDGILVVLASFLFYRVLGLRSVLAATASIFLCFNHSFIDFSRLAFRDNGAVLIELLALSALFFGIAKKSQFSTYLGGILTAIGFYLYYPARIVAPTWLLFLIVLAVARRDLFRRAELFKMGAIFALGLILTVAPFAVANLREPSRSREALFFMKETSFLFPQGRKVAQGWNGGKSELDALRINAVNSLTCFNNNLSDYGNQYCNEGHGIVDPLTGLLFWIGFLSLLVTSRAGTSTLSPSVLLMVSGVSLQLFYFAFVVNKAPNYGRMLVILPFATYFAAQGAEFLSVNFAGLLRNRQRAALIGETFIICISLAVIIWNIQIFSTYAIDGYVHGDDIGGTARYVEARQKLPNYRFIIVRSNDCRYFDWDTPISLAERIKPYLGASQASDDFTPEDMMSITLHPPFTLFMNGELWKANEHALRHKYPNAVCHKIADKLGLIALEDTSPPWERGRSARIKQVLPEAPGDSKHWDDVATDLDSALGAQRYAEVKAVAVEALKSPEALSKGSAFKSRVLYDLGVAEMMTGDYARAKTNLLESLDLWQKRIGKTILETYKFEKTLGDLCAEQKKWSEAETWYRKGLATVEKSQSEDYLLIDRPELIESYKNIALTLWKQGNKAKADEFFKKCPDTFHSSGVR